MSSTRTESMIPSPPARSGPARPWRLLSGVGALALVVGLGGGYAAGYANRPDPLTKTVTVTQLVPASPYSTTMTQTVDVTYDGTHAYYAGPAQVPAGATLTLHVAQNAAHPIGAVGIAKMPAGYTWEDLTAWVKAHPLFSDHPSEAAVLGWGPVDQGDLTLTLPAGLYIVVIGLPPQATSQSVAVGMITAS